MNVVYELGINLNSEGLMIDNIIGFRFILIMKFFVILDRVDVKEMGLRFLLMLLIVGVLRRGGILVIF